MREYGARQEGHSDPPFLSQVASADAIVDAISLDQRTEDEAKCQTAPKRQHMRSRILTRLFIVATVLFIHIHIDDSTISDLHASSRRSRIQSSSWGGLAYSRSSQALTNDAFFSAVSKFCSVK